LLIPVIVFAYILYLSWIERDTNSWPVEEYENFHKNLEG
jgi:hypothetical protein